MVLIVVAVCLCVGYILKHLVPTDKINPFIPLIMAVLGIFMNVWISGFKITPEILLGGMISGLASTGLYEAFKQFIEKK
ncbi:MAG: holin [Ruminococcaceae bacterium]|nr:holin [Oscillospiraceae bacterium]